MLAKNKKKIILLNPPAKGIFIRDFYCSFSSKANYYWPPQDLIAISGILADNYDVEVIDAVGQKINFKDCLEQLLAKNFDTIIFSTGTATLEGDLDFIKALKNKKEFKAIASSAIFNFAGAELFDKFKVLDAAIADFLNPSILNYLAGDIGNTSGIIYRDGLSCIIKKNSITSNVKIPTPMHDLFVNHKRSFPLCKSKFAVVVTSTGCPFKCKFCIAGQINFKQRDLNNILEELLYIKKLGINEVFFADPIFGVDKNYSIELCKRMMDLKLKWVCNLHCSINDHDFIELLKKAGCHTVMIGVESGDENILKRCSKGVTIEEVNTVFKICKNNHIRTLGYFIIGLPGENKDSILKTISLAKELDCDFISFDFAMPDFGTALRKELIENGSVSSDLLYGWDPSSKPLYALDSLSIKDLIKIRNRAYREFYLRPSYIKNRIIDIRSIKEFKNFIKGGVSLFLKK